MSDFYLTLPSDSSMDYFPDNTMTEFRVKLPHTIHLSGDWEVGLAEISYPVNWSNIPAVEEHFRYTLMRNWRPIKLKPFFWEDNPRALRDLMNDAIAATPRGAPTTVQGDVFKTHGFGFVYRSDIQKMALRILKRTVKVEITNKTLCRLLGFE